MIQNYIKKANPNAGMGWKIQDALLSVNNLTKCRKEFWIVKHKKV
jgi:hypothetical protein